MRRFENLLGPGEVRLGLGYDSSVFGKRTKAVAHGGALYDSAKSLRHVCSYTYFCYTVDILGKDFTFTSTCFR